MCAADAVSLSPFSLARSGVGPRTAPTTDRRTDGSGGRRMGAGAGATLLRGALSPFGLSLAHPLNVLPSPFISLFMRPALGPAIHRSVRESGGYTHSWIRSRFPRNYFICYFLQNKMGASHDQRRRKFELVLSSKCTRTSTIFARNIPDAVAFGIRAWRQVPRLGRTFYMRPRPPNSSREAREGVPLLDTIEERTSHSVDPDSDY